MVYRVRVYTADSLVEGDVKRARRNGKSKETWDQDQIDKLRYVWMETDDKLIVSFVEAAYYGIDRLYSTVKMADRRT